MDCKSEGVADQAAEYCKKPEAGSLKSMLHLLSLVLEVRLLTCFVFLAFRQVVRHIFQLASPTPHEFVI